MEGVERGLAKGVEGITSRTLNTGKRFINGDIKSRSTSTLRPGVSSILLTECKFLADSNGNPSLMLSLAVFTENSPAVLVSQAKRIYNGNDTTTSLVLIKKGDPLFDFAAPRKYPVDLRFLSRYRKRSGCLFSGRISYCEGITRGYRLRV